MPDNCPRAAIIPCLQCCKETLTPARVHRRELLLLLLVQYHPWLFDWTGSDNLCMLAHCPVLLFLLHVLSLQ